MTTTVPRRMAWLGGAEEEPEDEEPEVDPDCGIPKAGSDCFKKVKWAMSDGIYANPNWYPGVTPSSPFTKFQDRRAPMRSKYVRIVT